MRRKMMGCGVLAAAMLLSAAAWARTPSRDRASASPNSCTLYSNYIDGHHLKSYTYLTLAGKVVRLANCRRLAYQIEQTPWEQNVGHDKTRWMVGQLTSSTVPLTPATYEPCDLRSFNNAYTIAVETEPGEYDAALICQVQLPEIDKVKYWTHAVLPTPKSGPVEMADLRAHTRYTYALPSLLVETFGHTFMTHPSYIFVLKGETIGRYRHHEFRWLRWTAHEAYGVGTVWIGRGPGWDRDYKPYQGNVEALHPFHGHFTTLIIKCREGHRWISSTRELEQHGTEYDW